MATTSASCPRRASRSPTRDRAPATHEPRTLAALIGRTLLRVAAFTSALAATLAVGGAVTARADTEHSNLYLRAPSASKAHRIPTANDPYAFALDPAWSPDGSRIAFVYGVCDDCPGDIVTIDRRGRHRREFSAAVGARPAWAPDGRSITYVTTEQSIASLNLTNGRTSPLVAGGSQPVDNPAWSPDGSRLAFTRRVAPDNWDIFVYAPATRRTMLLVSAAHSDIEPVWSRDGRFIAYVRQLPNLRFAIAVIRPNGTGNRILTRGRGGAENPSWSPDGRHLSFVGFRTGKPEALWVIRTHGRGARRLTRFNLNVISATWAPKRDEIVFSARRAAASG